MFRVKSLGLKSVLPKLPEFWEIKKVFMNALCIVSLCWFCKLVNCASVKYIPLFQSIDPNQQLSSLTIKVNHKSGKCLYHGLN
jgi:hypothetical protein